MQELLLEVVLIKTVMIELACVTGGERGGERNLNIVDTCEQSTQTEDGKPVVHPIKD